MATLLVGALSLLSDTTSVYGWVKGLRSKSEDQLSPNEVRAIEERLKMVGALQTFSVAGDEDYRRVSEWLDQFIETKTRVNLSPTTMTARFTQLSPNREVLLERQSAVELRAQVVAWQAERRVPATIDFYPDPVMVVRAGDKLRLSNGTGDLDAGPMPVGAPDAHGGHGVLPDGSSPAP